MGLFNVQCICLTVARRLTRLVATPATSLASQVTIAIGVYQDVSLNADIRDAPEHAQIPACLVSLMDRLHLVLIIR